MERKTAAHADVLSSQPKINTILLEKILELTDI